MSYRCKDVASVAFRGEDLSAVPFSRATAVLSIVAAKRIVMKIIGAALLVLTSTATPCLAQAEPAEAPFFSGTIPADPSVPGTVRLTPEQREAALEYGASHPDRAIDGDAPSDGKIHGEVGVAIGTGGYRSTYGSAVVPLGDTGAAAFSFQTDRNNFRRRDFRRDQ